MHKYLAYGILLQQSEKTKKDEERLGCSCWCGDHKDEKKDQRVKNWEQHMKAIISRLWLSTEKSNT